MFKDTDRRTALELFALSAFSLYAELLVIWWMSSDIRAFSVFKTFPLVACYVGLGAGFAIGKDRIFAYTPLALVTTVCLMKLAEFTKFCTWMFPSTSIFNWQWTTVNMEVYACQFSMYLIPLLAGPFIVMLCTGARLGTLFDSLKPLEAYTINIVGAIAGSVAFTAVSAYYLPPWARLLPAVVLLLACYVRSQRSAFYVVVALLCAGLTIAVSLASPPYDKGVVTYWSPYQRLDLETIKFHRADATPANPSDVFVGYDLSANRMPYQSATDLSTSHIAALNLTPDNKEFLLEYQKRYSLPFLYVKPKTMLVVGSGLGNDIAEALRNNVETIEAVDIDPVIIKLGQTKNESKPYDSPRVHVTCDDARSFFNRCKQKYDLVVFSHLDSHVVTGQGSSARIDNFVYTKESFRKALNLLKPDGLMVISFCTEKKWFADRLYATITEAAGYKPIVLTQNVTQYAKSTFFVLGPLVQSGAIKAGAPSTDFSPANLDTAGTKTLTDDWPYLYLSTTDLDPAYLLIVFEILLLTALAGRKVLMQKASGQMWQMFFLGGAFILMELQSIGRLSLLYGSTWLTSAIAINGILVMILAANLITIRFADKLAGKQKMFYGFLLATLLISYLLPLDQIMSAGASAYELTRLGVTVIVLLPLLAAGMIFAGAFTLVKAPARALAFNLLGAVLGAMLEYLSNFVGIRNLLLVAAALYIVSYLCFPSGAVPEDATAEQPAG